MANPMTRLEDAEPLGLRPLSGLFLAAGVVFFAATMNPLIFDFFDAEDDAERLAHVVDNHTALRLLFTGIGVADAVLGLALWIWSRHVVAASSGRRRTTADILGHVAVVVGIVSALLRLTVWIEDAESFASSDVDALDIVYVVAGGAGFSITIAGLGYLMIRGAMPTWLGVIWVLCALLFWLGILPLWFFVGAVVFGVRGLIAFRPGSPALDRVSADKFQPAAEEAATTMEVQQ